jgi:hypothetical protein
VSCATRGYRTGGFVGAGPCACPDPTSTPAPRNRKLPPALSDDPARTVYRKALHHGWNRATSNSSPALAHNRMSRILPYRINTPVCQKQTRIIAPFYGAESPRFFRNCMARTLTPPRQSYLLNNVEDLAEGLPKTEPKGMKRIQDDGTATR